MTIAIASASEFPSLATHLWKSRHAITALLLTGLIVMALAQRGEASTCAGTPLTMAELTLPTLTDPV